MAILGAINPVLTLGLDGDNVAAVVPQTQAEVVVAVFQRGLNPAGQGTPVQAATENTRAVVGVRRTHFAAETVVARSEAQTVNGSEIVRDRSRSRISAAISSSR